MGANPQRGELAAILDGAEYRLCLTLGALAELEASYAAEDLGALVSRFAAGKLSATDIARVIGAGLRGGGQPIGDDDVMRMRCEGGAAGFAHLVAELLAVTFGRLEGEEPPPNP